MVEKEEKSFPSLPEMQKIMLGWAKENSRIKEEMCDEDKETLAKYGKEMKPKLINMVSGGLYRGQATAMLAVQDINILNVIDTGRKTRFLVEFKWWYGDLPSESRWQRTTICVEDDLPEDLILEYIAVEISLARHGLKELTGVSQDVRH